MIKQQTCLKINKIFISKETMHCLPVQCLVLLDAKLISIHKIKPYSEIISCKFCYRSFFIYLQFQHYWWQSYLRLKSWSLFHKSMIPDAYVYLTAPCFVPCTLQDIREERTPAQHRNVETQKSLHTMWQYSRDLIHAPSPRSATQQLLYK